MNPLEETLNIDTPENVTFGYEIAGIGSRFLAALIDTAAIILLQGIVDFMIIGLVNLSRDNVPLLAASSISWLLAFLGLVSLLFLWGYYIFFEMIWNGKTPGKRILKLRVLRSDGTPITISESVIRNLVRLVDFLPGFYGVGLIAIFINPQTRRLGDLAAGTVVVREADQSAQIKSLAAMEKQLERVAASGSRQPQAAPIATPFEGALESIPATTLPVGLLNYQDIQMIEMYFQRRFELTNRAALVSQLAAAMWGKMKLAEPVPDGKAAEEALAKIIAEYRQLHPSQG
jgi:uncharacterized RDD family membrane protein YckC